LRGSVREAALPDKGLVGSRAVIFAYLSHLRGAAPLVLPKPEEVFNTIAELVDGRVAGGCDDHHPSIPSTTTMRIESWPRLAPIGQRSVWRAPDANTKTTAPLSRSLQNSPLH
jgi:hypothetical protein